MKSYIIGIAVLLSVSMWGCLKDEGTYAYDFDSVSEIEIDTTGTDRTVLFSTWNIGDVIHYTPNVKYDKPENLVYRWFTLPYNYTTVTVGNSQVYPEADTISWTLDLNYEVALEPGNYYNLYFMAKDTVYDFVAFLTVRTYLSVPEAGAISGVYCLMERDGHLDVDVFGSARSLIFAGNDEPDWHEVGFWSSNHTSSELTGTPKIIYYSSSGDWYYILTDESGVRCSPAGLTVMDTWEEMFYSAPACVPEAMMCVNSCDFLINDGKLHCLYIGSAGDRKFPTAIGGSYDLAPFLATETLSTWYPTEGAIGAYQVVYDYVQNGFRPYFNLASTLSQFAESQDTLFDVNHMEGDLIYTATVNGGETMAVMNKNGSYEMDVACFYDVVDDGKLARYIRSLEGCENIKEASCFTSTNAGPALIYAAGNTVYSYSYTTGQTEANKIWSSDDASDVITCMSIIGTGGFPTGGRVLWVATWNESSQEGRIIEFEIDPTTGKVDDVYGPQFGAEGDSPSIFTGFGKVISMTTTM